MRIYIKIKFYSLNKKKNKIKNYINENLYMN